MSDKREYGLQLFILLAAFFLVVGITRGHDLSQDIHPETTISFQLAEEKKWEGLMIYDQKGQCVDRLHSGQFFAGQHRIDWPLNDQSGGVDSFQFRTSSEVQSGPMLFLK